MRLDATFVPQLGDLLTEYDKLRADSKRNDLHDLKPSDKIRFITRARAAVHRMASPSSLYAKQCEEIIKAKYYDGDKVNSLAGVLESLRADLEAGYLQNASGLIRGELFGDFLEMADHLNGEGYKDAAAVIAGSALEAHLRALCGPPAISVVMPNGHPKKADVLNADLAKAEVYSKLDQKNVTSWLGLRNDAAHGHYDKYTQQQVTLLIASVRDFITRTPS
jgi:hypothetical protein